MTAEGLIDARLEVRQFLCLQFARECGLEKSNGMETHVFVVNHSLESLGDECFVELCEELLVHSSIAYDEEQDGTAEGGGDVSESSSERRS